MKTSSSHVYFAHPSLRQNCTRCPTIRKSPACQSLQPSWRLHATPEKINDVDVKAGLESRSSVITDKNVPEGHKGLHGFLYGKGGAEVHEDSSQRYQFRDSEDDGSSLIPADYYLDSRDGECPLGVYALYDAERNLQYVGSSRNMVLAVKAHLQRVGEDRCAFVRSMVFMNKAMSTKESVEREAQSWLEEAGTTPPGNGVERDEWEGVKIKDLKPEDMSPKELEQYEGKKLKLRKAMGENIYDPVPGESMDSKERRLRTIRAVEGDNWSGVIGEQTDETVDKSITQEDPNQIVSPFVQARVHRSIGNENASTETLEMKVETVDRALDEVRPYLISDGGNVEVVSVIDGIVSVQMQGACGGCPSATATLKMGIERALKATFGDKLQEVVEVGRPDDSASVQTIDAHLDLLRPAIEGYGGTVEVSKVEDGICELVFEGPAPIGKGIRSALKDKFPDLKEVYIMNEEDV